MSVDWQDIERLVATRRVPGSDVAQLARVLAADIKQIGGGRDLTPDQVRALASTALPVVGQIAGMLFPQLKPEIAAVKIILSLSHRMTPEEEARWMDRASGGPLSPR
jgi:hypothetical protein